MASKYTREELIAALDAAEVGSVALVRGEYPLRKGIRQRWPRMWHSGNISVLPATLARHYSITHLIPAAALAQYAVEIQEASDAQ